MGSGHHSPGLPLESKDAAEALTLGEGVRLGVMGDRDTDGVALVEVVTDGDKEIEGVEEGEEDGAGDWVREEDGPDPMRTVNEI